MFKPIYIFTVVLVFCSFSAVAQRKLQEMDPDKQAEKDKYAEENKTDWRERVSFGGNLTGGFSNVGSYFLIQPQVFYRLFPKTIVGTGFTYIYWSQKYINYSTNQEVTMSDNAYGVNLLARQNLFGPVFAYAELMPMNFTSYNMFGMEKRIWANSLYLGGGYGGSGGGGYALILYDVLWKQNDPDPAAFTRSFYSSPWNFRIGFMF